MESWLAEAIGTIAGLCSTTSFVPQVVKLWREGDASAVSTRTYSVTVTAFALWILYGLMIASVPLILFNTVSLLLAGTVLVLKLRHSRRRGSGGEPARA